MIGSITSLGFIIVASHTADWLSLTISVIPIFIAVESALLLPGFTVRSIRKTARS